MKQINNYIIEKLRINKDTGKDKIQPNFVNDFGEGEYDDFNVDLLIKTPSYYKYVFSSLQRETIYNYIPEGSTVYVIKDENANHKKLKAITNRLKPEVVGGTKTQVHIFKDIPNYPNIVLLIHIFDSIALKLTDNYYIYETNK